MSSADAGPTMQKMSLASTQADQLLGLIADAYHRAVFANVNMRRVTEALESLRAVVLSEKDFYQIWSAIDAQIGIADSDGLQSVLVSLRGRYVNQICTEIAAAVKEAVKHDAKSGQRQWLRTYAEALNAWRFDLCSALIEVDLPVVGLEPRVVKALPRLTQYLRHEQWPPTFELFLYLAQHAAISDAGRARLLVTASEIQLYHYEKPDQSKDLLERAQELVSDENRVVNGWGEYWLQQNDKVKAKQQFERAIEQAPYEADGYINLADLYLQAEDFAAAEAAYQQAMRRDSGSASGPMGLIRLYGRPQLFPEYRDRLPRLLKRVIAVAPESTYAVYLAVGYDFQQNYLYEQAQQFYDQAIAVEPSRVDAYTWKGNAFLEANDADNARAAFQRAQVMRSELVDGYWSVAALYEEQQQWQEALDAYRQSLERGPHLARLISTKIGQMEWKLGRHSEAKAKVFEVLRSEPKDATALYVLQSFANDYLQELGKAEAALEIYEEIRHVKGPDYEADFQNNVGNIHSYNGDYRAATDSYAQAIERDPDDAVVHRNLAKALRELHEWDRAQEEIKTAFDLDHDEHAYDEEVGLLFNAMGIAHYESSEFRDAIACYERAIHHRPEDDVLRSNLALAWESVEVPGQKLGELENAISALRRAVNLQPNNEEYAARLGSLEHELDLVRRYGELIAKIPVTTPIRVEVSDNLVAKIDPLQDGSTFMYEDIPAMRERIKRDLGVMLPGIRFRSDSALPLNTYRILIHEAWEEDGTIQLNWRYSTTGPDMVEALHVPEHRVILASHPRTGEPGYWLPEEYWQSAVESGLELWTDTDFLISHLQTVILRNLPTFFGIPQAQYVIDQWAQQTDRRPSPTTGWDVDTRLGCARLLRTLLDEQVPITAHEEILEVIANRRLDGRGVVEAVRDVRLRLKRHLPGNAPETQRLHLPEELEVAIGACLQKQDGWMSYSVSPVETHRFLVEIRNLLPVGKRNVALVVRDPDLRPFVRRLVAYTIPYLMVLSVEELIAGDGMTSPTHVRER